MSLVETVEQDQQCKRGEALTKYRELLARNSNSEPGDKEALRAVMATLGKATEHLRRDLYALETAAECEKAIANRPAAEATLKQIQKERSKLHVEYEAARKSIEKEFHMALRKLDELAAPYHNLIHTAVEAASTLAKVQREHGDLFERVDSETCCTT